MECAGLLGSRGRTQWTFRAAVVVWSRCSVCRRLVIVAAESRDASEPGEIDNLEHQRSE